MPITQIIYSGRDLVVTPLPDGYLITPGGDSGWAAFAAVTPQLPQKTGNTPSKLEAKTGGGEKILGEEQR